MELTQVYLIALCGAVAVPVAFAFARAFYNCFRPRVRRLAVLLVHSNLVFCQNITWLQGTLLVSYLAVNTIVLTLGTHTVVVLAKKSARIASANLMLLFLGGRTNPAASLVHLSLPNYYLMHKCISFVAICEILVHTGISLRQAKPNSTLISGSITSGCLVALVLTAVLFGRRIGRFFGKLHILLCLGAAYGLVWHVLMQDSLSSKIPAFVSCALWGGTHVYRITRMFLFQKYLGTVNRRRQKNDMIILTLSVNKPVSFYPGCYYYLFFKGPLPFRDLFHGYAMMPFWLDTENGHTEISFLLTRTGSHCLSLAAVSEGNRVRLDGPYGQNHRLHNCETVVLTAKGMGIVGALPYALHLAERRRHDDDARKKEARLRDSNEPVFGDLSRHVDLIWWLEHNEQEDWIARHLKKLQMIDSKRILVVWCIYPDVRENNKKTPFEVNDYWKIRYNFDLNSFSRELRQEARYPGDTVLLACGDGVFVNTMRQTAVENTTAEREIKFVEVEFRPSAMTGSDSAKSAFIPSAAIRTPRSTRKRARDTANQRRVESVDSQSTLLDGYDMVPEMPRKPGKLGSSKRVTSSDGSDVV